jgi:hypothetical protein
MPALEPAEEKEKPMRKITTIMAAAIPPLGLAARGAGRGERAVTAPGRG